MNAVRPLVSSLRARLLLLVLLAVVPALGLILFTAEEWRRHEINDAQADALRFARHASAIHERLIDESHDLLFSLARLPAALQGEKADLSQILLAFLREHPSHTNLGVITPNGKIFLSARPPGDSIDVADRPFFRRAVATRAFAIGDYEVDPIAGRGTVTFAYPVLDKAGHVQQILFTTAELAWVSELAGEALLPAGTLMTVFDEKGTIVAHEPDPRGWIGRSAAQDPAFLTVLAQKREGTVEGASLDNIPRVLAFKPLLGRAGEGNLYVSIGIPNAVATAEADRILARNLWGLGLAALLTIVVAWVGGDLFLLRQVKILVNTTRRLSGGDLSARTGLPHEPGELNQLASAFDEMATTLESRQQEILRQHQALADMERRFRGLIEHSSDGIAVLGAGRAILYASPTVTRMLGYAVEEFAGCDAIKLIHPDDRDAATASFADVLEKKSDVVTAQLRVRHKHGSFRWVEVVATNRLEDPSVQGIVANYRDITERKQAEEALRKANEELEVRVQERTADLVNANEALTVALQERERAQDSLKKLSSAIEHTTDSVFITNRDGVIEYVNPAFEVLTGYTREEAVGKTRRILRSGEHDRKFYEQLWGRILAGEVFRAVFINRKKDGELYYEEQAITPLQDRGGTVTHFVAAGRDITQRIRTEEALRRLNERLEKETERIGNLLHDEAGQFLTSAHIMLAEIAREVPQAERERLQEVRLHLDQVEKRLRTLSHELRPRVLDDLGLIAALEFLAEGVSKRTGMQIGVNTSLAELLPPMTEATFYRFAQEALTNTSKHARATQVTILLERRAGKIRCSIRDDGVGFDVSAALASRGDPGLGLRGIQDRVEALGGTLQIVSEPGHGTELVATIPLETDDATPNSLGG
jgi:PAS domain S-box-containing protein